MARSKTGGRKAGTPNKKTVEREPVEATAISKIEALLKAAGIELSSVMPLDYALAVLRHPDSTPEERRWACEKALPFCHAKPTPDIPLQHRLRGRASGKSHRAASYAANPDGRRARPFRIQRSNSVSARPPGCLPFT